MPSPPTVRVLAPAKVNLTLHVTGRRDDGYHLLDTLVAFAGIGDWVSVAAADALSLEVTGAFAGAVPAGPENLVWRAAQALAPERGAAIQLHKVLPPASGIGGGSADAAAALRGLALLWGLDRLDPEPLAALGADVPMCLLSAPVRAEGIGERLTLVPPLPDVHVVLVNPGVPVPTAEVFARLEFRDNPPMPQRLPAWPTAESLAEFLATQRNDLSLAAEAVAPVIAEVGREIAAQPACLVARMSGSGATCFGLFAAEAEGRAAARALKDRHPDWWVGGGVLFRDAAPAAPQRIRDTT